MAPTTATKQQQLVQSSAANKSLPPPPPHSSSQDDDDDDVVRQLVTGRWRSSLSSGLRAALACTIVGQAKRIALSAVVALPESVGLVAKRIALGQAIIVYVAKFQHGERPSRGLALLHPANVVACTALGVAAALLAVLLPWPRLATREARDKCRAYKVVAAERVRVMADAFATGVGVEAEACSRQRRWQMAACMSEANRLASASTALLNRMNAIKVS
jgi:hypothetical protein